MPTTFDFAELSQAAYDYADIVNVCHQRGYRCLVYATGGGDNDTTHAYVITDRHQNCFIVFRGTEPHKIRHWLIDLDTRKDEWVYGKVHAGFARSVNYVWEAIKSYIGLYSSRGYKIWYTGHSKGAAEATVAASRAAHQGFAAAGLVTFGSPRVGTSKFTRSLDLLLNGKAIRYTHNNDIVTRVPMDAGWLVKYIPFGYMLHDFLPFGFSHLRNRRHINRNGEVIPVTRSIKDRFRVLSDRVRGRVMAGKDWWKDGSKDHNMFYYLNHICRSDTFEI